MLPVRIAMWRMSPFLSHARNWEILSRPGQSSCFKTMHAEFSVTMRRMTPGDICTENVNG